MTAILLTAHLLCMNLASAGPLGAIALDELHRRGNRAAAMASRKLLIWSLAALPLGALFGLTIAGLRWNEDYATLWTARLGWKAAWGVGELAFSALIGIAIVVWPPKLDQPPRRWGWRTWSMLLTATNLLYHFPALMSVAAVEAGRSRGVAEALRGSAFLAVMYEPAVLSKIVHVALASVAGTGVAVLGFAAAMQKRVVNATDGAPDGPSQSDVAGVREAGAWLALAPTMAQLGVGSWALVASPPNEQTALLGGDTIATVCLGASIALALWLAQDLAAIAMGDDSPKLARRTMIQFTLVVALMSVSLDRIHTIGRMNVAQGNDFGFRVSGFRICQQTCCLPKSEISNPKSEIPSNFCTHGRSF